MGNGMENHEKLEKEWFNVEDKLPKDNTEVVAYDTDSLTPEKKLLFRDEKFLYCAYGVELDYTHFITKWKKIN